MNKQPNSRYCFLCGLENASGLKLRFYEDDAGRVLVEFTPRPEHQGYPGVLHGGIACALLDETIGRTLVRKDLWAMTVALDVRYHRPVPVGQAVTVVGEVIRLRSRTMEGRGEIRLPGGTVAVSAEARYVLLTPERTAAFRSELGFWQVVPDGGEGAAPG